MRRSLLIALIPKKQKLNTRRLESGCRLSLFQHVSMVG